MDESNFESRSNTRKVVAICGSPNVHTSIPETSFHLSFVVAVAACGFAVPPLFIVPGMRLPRKILNECTVEGAAIITAAKDFINGDMFLKWIDHFACLCSLPIMLICDGCSSHIRLDTVERFERSQVLLVCLPPNATHLVQPLDVAVFGPFKGGITSQITKIASRSSTTSVERECSEDCKRGLRGARDREAKEHQERICGDGSVPAVRRHDGAPTGQIHGKREAWRSTWAGDVVPNPRGGAH
uniref:PREDICTED: similar to ENSANGP00000028549 putative n=1 Tax=Albugo laibachii Nc14 TaxID=890382 RepID=F0X2S1_9STRA|nr:PREDICTED: similar to ENSANGP00000028549 putative [Albugo laibachii Nc14]|eukprot:CCA28217.1 PREDICTED: similar to ENSANGP00000028549 putative [Albugo laibachii Nc14]